MSSSLRILVSGFIAQHPQLGGVTWDYLQYLLGLRELGHDVFYVEDSGSWPYLLQGRPGPNGWIGDGAANVEHLSSTMERFGFGGRWAYRLPSRSQWFGLSDRRRREVVRSADLLINVSGSLERVGNYRVVPRLAYIDTDPVFTQVRLRSAGEDSFRRRAAHHDVHFSFGESLSRAVLDTPYRWRPTRQPVVLSEWRHSLRARAAYTTVMSWTSFEPFCYGGRAYAQKDVELMRFLELPGRVRPAQMELALTPPPREHSEWESAHDDVGESRSQPAPRRNGSGPRDLLSAHGWGVVSAAERCGTPDAYRRYIQTSKAEWSVAKNGYVVGQPGWFSCRSACYLAAGRPVIVQHTGFSRVLPTGEGLLAFTTPDEAVEAIQRVHDEYDRHCRAARDISEEYFDARGVLERLVEEAMTATSPRASVRPQPQTAGLTA